MERKKTTTITSETLETIVVRRLSSRSTWLWCVECAERVEMLTPDEAAALAKVSTRAIYRRIETGEIHHTETAERTLLVCPKRLSP